MAWDRPQLFLLWKAVFKHFFSLRLLVRESVYVCVEVCVFVHAWCNPSANTAVDVAQRLLKTVLTMCVSMGVWKVILYMWDIYVSHLLNDFCVWLQNTFTVLHMSLPVLDLTRSTFSLLKWEFKLQLDLQLSRVTGRSLMCITLVSVFNLTFLKMFYGALKTVKYQCCLQCIRICPLACISLFQGDYKPQWHFRCIT